MHGITAQGTDVPRFAIDSSGPAPTPHGDWMATLAVSPRGDWVTFVNRFSVYLAPLQKVHGNSAAIESSSAAVIRLTRQGGISELAKRYYGRVHERQPLLRVPHGFPSDRRNSRQAASSAANCRRGDRFSLRANYYSYQRRVIDQGIVHLWSEAMALTPTEAIEVATWKG